MLAFLDNLRLAGRTFLTNPLRSLLTLLGIVIGVATVISMMAMIEGLRLHNLDRMAAGKEPFGLGVGIHTGVAVVGNIGHEDRHDYTAIGDTVNLAARLEAVPSGISIGVRCWRVSDRRCGMGSGDCRCIDCACGWSKTTEIIASVPLGIILSGRQDRKD